MWVSRLRVNGGFLAGLDVPLASGLNVIVGPRGVGKTTLLELIRHALGVPHADDRQARERLQAVKKLLGSGEVVLDVQHGAEGFRVVVDAEGNGRLPFLAEGALMLGQNELEEIASSPVSRLRLIDLRAGIQPTPLHAESAASLTRRLAELRIEMAQISDSFAARPSLLSDRAELLAQEADLVARGAGDLGARRDQLRSIEDELITVTGHLEAVDRANDVIAYALGAEISVARSLEELGAIDGGLRFSAAIRSPLENARNASRALTTSIEQIRDELDQTRSQLGAQSNELRLTAEPIRAELEQAELGLGQATARLRNVDAQLAHLTREAQRHETLIQTHNTVLQEREGALNQAETLQEAVFQARRSVAQQVSGSLSQNVTVVVSHLAESTRFRETLVLLLQGSNLQYRPLAESLARDLLPRQLLRLVETNDVASLAQATRLSDDRAARVIGTLNNPEALAQLSQVTLDDLVDFTLRDGVLQKSVDELSTGQKCAVTLPIVLTEHSRTLLLDQPEDHLDNAYLVQNVVTGLIARGHAGAQTLVATHNPNIPVLGSAEQVVALQSDGARGFVSASGHFAHSTIVDVITGLMEGGAEAFRRRAEFYEQFGQHP